MKSDAGNFVCPESEHKDSDQSCVAFEPIEEKAHVGPWERL